MQMNSVKIPNDTGYNVPVFTPKTVIVQILTTCNTPSGPFHHQYISSFCSSPLSSI